MSTTKIDRTSQGFTAEERAAMKERANEAKAEARANKNNGDGESKELTAAEEARIVALVKKAAVSG